MKGHQEEWELLCAKAAVEQDPDELLRLTERVVELLEAKYRRIQEQRDNHVFQIAYDQVLLIKRESILLSRGYEVTSVLGNDAAKQLLMKRSGTVYRIFIVGHAAPSEDREEMVRWLKERFPKTKVLAGNPPDQDILPRADFNVILNGPEQWLSAVASAA